nr:hypothetical protein [uncultured Marinifilum sp.]
MVYILLKQPTKNIVSWKKAFDKFLEYRKIGGELSCNIYQTPKKENELIVLSQWTSMDDAIEFLASQSFEMIKDLESEKPLTVKLLNQHTMGQFIKTLH